MSDKPKRGRPKLPDTVVVSVRLHTSVYDRCCQEAFRHGVHVSTVIRSIVAQRLTKSAD